jgi:uncharacterized membrane protein (DUF485 family)
MTTISHEPTRGVSEQRSLWTQLRIPEMWASLAIIAMWVSVMFATIYGPDFVSTSSATNSTTIPSGVWLGLFALFGTWIVARHGFRHDRTE